jgi:hypothetical protein
MQVRTADLKHFGTTNLFRWPLMRLLRATGTTDFASFLGGATGCRAQSCGKSCGVQIMAHDQSRHDRDTGDAIKTLITSNGLGN